MSRFFAAGSDSDTESEYSSSDKSEATFSDSISEINFESRTPQMYKSVEETPFSFVNNEILLQSMIDHLLKVNEIAIDLEHHSHRTYLGITCLM